MHIDLRSIIEGFREGYFEILNGEYRGILYFDVIFYTIYDADLT